MSDEKLILGHATAAHPDPEVITRGYVNASGLDAHTISGYVVAGDPSITTVGFTSMTERLKKIGTIRKKVSGDALSRIECDSVNIAYDNEDLQLFYAAGESGLLYPKYFEGSLTRVARDVLEDSNQNFVSNTLTGTIEIVTGKAVGKRYFIIYNSVGTVTVLPDPDDAYSTTPEEDGVKVGDAYRIDASHELWMLLKTGFRNIPGDRILYLGGFVEPSEIENNPAGKSVVVRVLGFEKLLERYHAYNICKSQGQLYFLTGVSIKKWFPSADTPPTYGPRTLSFAWDDTQIEGIEVYSVQAGNKPGLKTIEFRPPYYFRYSDGTWYARKTEQTEYLYDNNQNTIAVKFSGKYSDIPQEMFIYIEDPHKPYVSKSGMPTLQLGDGKPVTLGRTFISVIHEGGYSGTGYRDITDIVTWGKRVRRDGSSYVSIFSTLFECLYVASPFPFSGAEFDLMDFSDFDGTIWIQYAQSIDSWKTLTYTEDETNQCANSGHITWEMPRDWVPTSVVIGDHLRNVYLVRFQVVTRNSGALDLRRIKRTHRIYDNDGVGVDIKVIHDLLPLEDTEDTVIIKKDGIAGAWYNVIDFHTLAQYAATEFGFPSACRTMEALKFDWSEPRIAVWGGLPHLDGENKVPEAVAWDSYNKILYVGYEDELWKIPQNGCAEKVCEIPPFYHFKLHIRRLQVTHSGLYINGLAWKPYDDTGCRHVTSDISFPNLPYGGTEERPTAAILFRYNTLTNKLAYDYFINSVDTSWPSLITGEVCYRLGRHITDDAGGDQDYEYTTIGQKNWTSEGSKFAGENICAPIPCVHSVSSDTLRKAFVALRSGLLEDSSSLSVSYRREFYYQIGKYGLEDCTLGHFWNAPPGWFFLGNWSSQANEFEIHYRWSLGQRGFIAWDDANDRWRVLTWNGTEYKVISCGFNDYQTAVNSTLWSPGAKTFDNDNLLCSTCYGPDNIALWTGWIKWNDLGTNISTAYIALLRNENLYTPYTIQFNFSTGTVEPGSSIQGDEQYCVPIEMVYESSAGELHGCLLNRNDLSYHYFIFYMGKLYTTSIGDNPNFQLKAFVVHPTDNQVYCALCDTRYGNVGARILKMTFNSALGASHGFTHEFMGTVDDAEYDIVEMQSATDRIVGVTGPSKGLVFQIGTEFYPRVQQAALGDRDGRELFSDLCTPFAFRTRIKEDNTLILKKLNM